MFTYKDEQTNKLYNGCKVCGNKSILSDDKKIVYKSNISLNIYEILNKNENLIIYLDETGLNSTSYRQYHWSKKK
jgi:hypothetical protein